MILGIIGQEHKSNHILSLRELVLTPWAMGSSRDIVMAVGSGGIGLPNALNRAGVKGAVYLK